MLNEAWLAFFLSSLGLESIPEPIPTNDEFLLGDWVDYFNSFRSLPILKLLPLLDSGMSLNDTDLPFLSFIIYSFLVISFGEERGVDLIDISGASLSLSDCFTESDNLSAIINT